MQIVIDIPDWVYKHIVQGDEEAPDENISIDAIRNGTPLPKGHGRLIDANNLKHAFISWSMAVQGFFTDFDIASIVYNSPTIIEADTESEEV